MQPEINEQFQKYIQTFVVIAIGGFSILTILEFMRILINCFL